MLSTCITRLGVTAGLFLAIAGCSAKPRPVVDSRVVGDVAGAVSSSSSAAAKPVVVAAALAESATTTTTTTVTNSTTTTVTVTNGCGKQGMVPIEGRYCIDRYEASLVEVTSTGEEKVFSPYSQLIGNENVRAVSVPAVYPQGYISANQAARACNAAGKRLCKITEWVTACRGPDSKRYGYGDKREVGRCNDNGKNPVLQMYGPRFTNATMNQPQLNQLEGTLAKTGEHVGCSNGYGVFDMVGNLHEWVADPNGTFYGGYYQDVSSWGHGEGCMYQTTAHEARYHDYSTGFRCCADLAAPTPTPKAATPPPAKLAASPPPALKRRK